MEEFDQNTLCSEVSVLSEISKMPSITCTLGTHEIPTLVSLYQPLLVRCVRSIELIPHLKKVIDDGKYLYMTKISLPTKNFLPGSKIIELLYLSCCRVKENEINSMLYENHYSSFLEYLEFRSPYRRCTCFYALPKKNVFCFVSCFCPFFEFITHT